MTQMTHSPSLAASHVAVADTVFTPATLIPAAQAAVAAAREIPVEDFGPRYATYGGLVRIEAEHFATDARGPAQATRWLTFATPAQAFGALEVMLAEGRVIYGISAVRGALHR